MNEQTKNELRRKKDREYYAKNKKRIQKRRKELLTTQKREELRKKVRERYHNRRGLQKCLFCQNLFKPNQKYRKYCSDRCADLGIKKREKQHSKRYYQQHKKEFSIYSKRDYIKNKKPRLQELRKQADKLIGFNCVICGEKKAVNHEKRGKRHTSNPKYLIEHYKDFIPLCQKCHYVLHYCLSRISNFNIERFLSVYTDIQL